MSIFSKVFGKWALAGHVPEEEGFLDIDLPIANLRSTNDGMTLIDARGTVEGEDIGFVVLLGSGWRPKQVENSEAVFYWGTGGYRRMGPESDRFVQFLAKGYRLLLPSTGSMLSEVDAEVVGLNCDPGQVSTLGGRMKFFFHSSDEARYAEVFTNVNLEAGVVEFHEKDNEYRSALLRALTEP